MRHGLFTFLCLAATTLATAAAQSTLPNSLITDDTIIVVRADLKKLDAERLVAELRKVLPASPQADRMYDDLVESTEQFRAAGVQHAYVLVEPQDFGSGDITMLLPYADDTKDQAVRAAIERVWSSARVRDVEGTLVAENPRTPRSEAAGEDRARHWSQALTAAPSAALEFVVIPSPDQRRVLGEMPFQLPSGNGQVSLNKLSGIQWLALSIETGEEIKFDVVVEMGSAQAASELQQQIQQALVALPKDPLVKEKLPMLAGMIEGMIPRVDGSRLTLAQNQAWKSWRVLLSAALSSAKQQAQSTQCVTHMKMLALAMHNFHDTHGSFPPNASYDENGRPLLSWRVFLLPYLDASDLYQQFRLHEPWDSEHNRPLIEKMPEVFSCENPELAEKGMTTLLVPHGEGTVFSGREGVALKDIKDGSSHTAMIFAVAPDQAVIWTKPADLEIDMDQPLKGLADPERDRFYMSLADGAVLTLPTDVDPKKFRGFLLRADGDAGSR